MNAQLLQIVKKHRQYHRFLASLNDFTLLDGDWVEAEWVINNPNVSLYCLDEKSKRAIFAELPPGTDLARAPFVCRTQFEQCIRLIAVPYAGFIRMAATLPEVPQPVFMHTTGRSGSTLLHHAFNGSGAAISLSEPDVPTQIANLRHNRNGEDTPELRELVQSTVRHLFHSFHTENKVAHVIKFRSHGIQVMDLFQSVFPQAKNLFLYRPATDFVASGYRIYQNHPYPSYASLEEWQKEFERFWGTDLSHLSRYVADPGEAITVVKELTLEWIISMEWYQDQVKRGIPSLAVSFNKLVSTPQHTLQKIFDHTGVPLHTVRAGLTAFERDSQAGTPLGRKDAKRRNKQLFDQEEADWVTATLQRHPELNVTDFRPSGVV